MGFVKLFVSREHIAPERIEETYRRWLKADAVIGDPAAIDALKEYNSRNQS
jgi:hypothetical protein